jgi:hypothetical protein
MKRAILVAMAVILAGCGVDRAIASPLLPDAPALTVQPSGVTATIVACYSRIAELRINWAVVAGPTRTTAFTSLHGSGRVAPHTRGSLLMPLPYGTYDIHVVNWEPDGSGRMSESPHAVLAGFAVAKANCP